MASIHELRAAVLAKLGEIDEVVLRCKMELVRSSVPLTVQTETRVLRAALDRIADLHSEADELLDQFECEAGLVDQNGKRYDEPVPARMRSVEMPRVCLACQQSATGRCRAHGGEVR
jgi:hypothetical protein